MDGEIETRGILRWGVGAGRRPRRDGSAIWLYRHVRFGSEADITGLKCPGKGRAKPQS